METLKVLVVDDEEGIRQGIARVLKKFTVDFPFAEDEFSYETIDAATGEEAIELINGKQPDIVLLDNVLPGIEGVNVLEYINKNNLNILVMMITSHASLDLAVRATELGAYDFVSKPFTPQELRTSMENITKHLYLLRMTRKMTEAGKHIRFQFLSMLSHELKAPINAIQGYLQIIQNKEYGDHIDEYQTMINRSIQRVKGMRHLIMDLLDFTRLDASKTDRKHEKVNMVKIAKLSVDTLNAYAIQKDIKIKINHRGSVTIIADPREMEIIFNNLISNAIKYNVQNGSVDIDIEGTEKNLLIKVKDSGIGMKDEDIARLFQEFFRIKNKKTKNINGSGLGLSILKRITNSYNGTVDVDSCIDKGSTFTVVLPIS